MIIKQLTFALVLSLLLGLPLFAQDKTTGGVKGIVRLPDGKEVANVTVEARQAEKVVGTAHTGKYGDFKILNLKPGLYRFVFNKAGLSEGVSKEIEVKAKTVFTLKNLILIIDQGTLALVRGSVFDNDGRIARNVKVEVIKISGDSAKKIGEKFTDDNGDFAFRLPPDAALYRFVATAEDFKPTNKELAVDGAEIYRLAISLEPARKQKGNTKQR